MSRLIKKILVTGISGALGSAVAERYSREGVEVVGLDLRENPNFHSFSVDLTSADRVREVFQKSELQAVEGFVHCAGGFQFQFIDQISDQEIDFLINLNLKSSIYLLRELLPRFKKNGFGRAVLVGAKAALSSGSGMGVYAASKAGIHNLVSSCNEEVKDNDININAVLPSILDTPANRQAMPEAVFSDWVKLEELSEIIFGLTSPSSSAIRGALIPVSGRV